MEKGYVCTREVGVACPYTSFFHFGVCFKGTYASGTILPGPYGLLSEVGLAGGENPDHALPPHAEELLQRVRVGLVPGGLLHEEALPPHGLVVEGVTWW